MSILTGKILWPSLCKALHIEETKTRRIVLDVRYHDAVVAYVEMYAEETEIEIIPPGSTIQIAHKLSGGMIGGDNEN